jgi:hypothetical protein
MKNNLHYPIIILCLLISNLAFSQPKSDVPFDTTAYLLPKFTDGIIKMKDGKLAGGKLNYNTVIDEMQFISDKNEILSVADPSVVVQVAIGDRNFYYLKNYFFELVSDGNILLFSRIHVKRFEEKIGAYGGTSSTSSITSVSSYTSDFGTLTKLNAGVKVSLQTEVIYYIMVNGKYKLVLNKNDLLKLFTVNKELIKQEMDKQNIKFDSVESFKKIVDWINTKGIKD